MYHVELYLRVRLACHRDGLSQREAARRFGIDRKTVAKILKHSVPPGYQRGQAPKRPKLDPYTGIIDQILEDDKSESKKQRHTCKRIFEWLRDEHGYSGGITIVTDYVRVVKAFVDQGIDCSAPGSLDTSLSHAAGLIEIAACHA